MKKGSLKMMIMESSPADMKRDRGKKEMAKESAEYKKPVKKTGKVATGMKKGKKC